jgi:hypothetical protein
MDTSRQGKPHPRCDRRRGSGSFVLSVSGADDYLRGYGTELFAWASWLESGGTSDGHRQSGSGRHPPMNQITFWKKSVSLARLYRFSTDNKSGDGKRLILK